MISIHEAAKASTIKNDLDLVTYKISIHEAAKASTLKEQVTILICLISIHEAAKASTTIGEGINGAVQFQSTKPQRLRHLLKTFGRIRIYFNPRSRKGFDNLSTVPFFVYLISIHEAAKASTWGAGAGTPA